VKESIRRERKRSGDGRRRWKRRCK